MNTIFSLLFFIVVGGSVPLWGFRHFYAVCQPNQALVIYGRRRRLRDREGTIIGYRLVKGGGTLCLPLVEEVASMDLGNVLIQLEVRSALTKGGIRVSVEAVANVKIAGHEPGIHNAVERLLGQKKDIVRNLAQITLESNLRGVMAMLTPEEINADKEAFAKALQAEAQDDLTTLGLELDSLQITNVYDKVKYLDSIGRLQQVELLRDSRIAEAEAKARARIVEAENEKRTELVRVQRDISVATADAERRIEDATTRQEAMVAEARSTIAADLARVEAELPMQEERIQQVRYQLQADVVAPAEASCQRSLADAKAGAADIIEAGRARAEGMRALVRSYLRAGPDARTIYLLQHLEPLLISLRSAIPPIEVQNVHVIADPEGRPPSLPTLLAQVKEATGFDPRQVFQPRPQDRSVPRAQEDG